MVHSSIANFNGIIEIHSYEKKFNVRFHNVDIQKEVFFQLFFKFQENHIKFLTNLFLFSIKPLKLMIIRKLKGYFS